MEKAQNSPLGPAAVERRAFIFYTHWYTDAIESLKPEEVNEFLLMIVRYAAVGIEPDERATPIVRTMFGLIRNGLDADLRKYEEVSEENRRNAATSAAKRRSPVKHIVRRRIKAIEAAEANVTADVTANVGDVTGHDVDVVENQQQQRIEPIHNTQYTEHNTQNTMMNKEEEEALPRRDDVKAYWAAHSYKSSADEFYDYYEARHWLNARGLFIRSWKRAAVMWEDKFCRDVLPQRRREARALAAAEAQERHQTRAAEAAALRRATREAREAEEERRQRTAVSPQQAKLMYQRALDLCNGDADRAMTLMRRASDEEEVFKRLMGQQWSAAS